MSGDPIPCPVCLHGNTIRRRGGLDPDDDPHAVLRWAPPSRQAGAAVITRWDGGCWVCEACGARLTSHDAGILLDAALHHARPGCGEGDEFHMPAEARRAMEGGGR